MYFIGYAFLDMWCTRVKYTDAWTCNQWKRL